MSIIFDNEAHDYTASRQSINEQVSRLKYGNHAAHLTASIDAPSFRECPSMDDLSTCLFIDRLSPSSIITHCVVEDD